MEICGSFGYIMTALVISACEAVVGLEEFLPQPHPYKPLIKENRNYKGNINCKENYKFFKMSIKIYSEQGFISHFL